MASDRSDLRGFFHPKSIAIFGVSTGPYRFGGQSFLLKLIECGFPGRIYPIHPKAEEIRGIRAYPDLRSLPEVPDLALVSVAAQSVPMVLTSCGRTGVKFIHILSSGFRETGTGEGRELEDRILSISKEKGLRVIGPNCMGPYCPASGLTLWGAIPGMSGPLGVISQSGNMTQRLTEYAFSLGLGVDKAVSFGNGTVLDSVDFLEFMAGEEGTRLIAMYLESVREGRKFFELVREVNPGKPIILWKGGESEAGSRTASSHTGALSGEEKIWEALVRQTGVIWVRSMNEWMDALMALAFLPAPGGKGIFLIGGGGGNSVTQSDACIRAGLEIPGLSGATMDYLRSTVPTAGSIAGNPLDMFRAFQDAAYLREILNLAYEDPAVSMVIIDRIIPRKAFHLPDLPDSTPAIIEFLKSRPDRKPTVFIVDSEGGDRELVLDGLAMRSRFCLAGIPAYPSLQRAAQALRHLSRYHAWRQKARDLGAE
jgi:acyl-CoA synthetase (NDP forming)